MNLFAKKFYTKFIYGPKPLIMPKLRRSDWRRLIKISFLSLALIAFCSSLLASEQNLQIIAKEVIDNLQKKIELLEQQHQSLATKIAQEENSFKKIATLKEEIEKIKQQIIQKEREVKRLPITNPKYEKTQQELIKLRSEKQQKKAEKETLEQSIPDYDQKSTYHLLNKNIENLPPESCANMQSMTPPEKTALIANEKKLKELEYQKDQLLVAIQLFSKAETDDPQEEIFSPEMWRDVYLFSNPYITETKTLWEEINRTESTSGSLFLAMMLASPSSDISLLEQNKRIIQPLKDDEALYKQLKTELQNFKTAEKAYFSFYAQLFLNEDKAQNVVQFNQLLHAANNKSSILRCYLVSPFLCATKNSIKHLGTSLPMMAIMTLIYWGMGANISEGLRSLASPETYWHAITSAWFWSGFIFQQAATKLASKAGQARNLLNLIGPIISPMIARTNPIQYPIISTPCHWITSFVLQIKDQLFYGGDGKVIKEITPYLQKTQALLQSLQQLHSIANQNDTLKPLANDIKTFFDEKEKQDNEFAKLLQLCEQPEITEEQKKEAFNAMKNLMIKMKNPQHNAIFVNALKAAGRIDAYLSLATLVKEERGGKQYCLVNYIDPQSYPHTHIRFEGLWNPIQQDMDPFYSDMTKTLYQPTINYLQPNQLQAIAIAAVLAHLGIAPAQSAQITPLHYIGTSIAPLATTGHETEKFKDIVTNAYALDSNKYGLILIDNSRLNQLTQADLGNYSCYQKLREVISSHLLPSCDCCLALSA